MKTSRRPFLLDARFVVSSEIVESVRNISSSSGKFTFVESSERLRVHTLHGVPGKLIDVLLPDNIPNSCVCEIGLKKGSYDGNRRWRIAFRAWEKLFDPSKRDTPNIQFPDKGILSLEEESNYITIIAKWYMGGIWAQSFPQMRYKPDPGSRIGIFMYQWKQWFSFLPGEEARTAAEVWDQLEKVKECEDIVALNRMASSMLYDLAVSLGWRKLTLKEKGKYGLSLESDPWQRVDGLVSRLVAKELGSNGIGQYTLESSLAHSMRLPKGVCNQCNELESECACR